MHFRAQRKLQGEVSLSEAIETDKAGNALYLQDVVGADDTMQEDLEGREDQQLIRRLVAERLTPREADVIRRRYGLDGHPPQTQREIDQKVVELVKAEHAKAIRILTDNRAKLDELAKYLYEKETITGEEFMNILNREDESAAPAEEKIKE